MKKVNRILSMLLVLALVFSLGVTAMAAEATLTGSITIKESETVPLKDKTFNAYKILDATFVNGTGPEGGVAYTVPAELVNFYKTRYSLNEKAVDFGEQVAAKIAAESDIFAFAKDALAAAKAAGNATGSVKGGAEDHSVVINNLPFGYYVVEDVGAATPISALMLDTVGGVSIQIKADKPSIDKKIDGKTDTDPSTNDKVDTNNAAIGDKVPYILTSKVPDMTGYKKYFFVVNDTLSKGLTFNNDVVITIGGVTIAKDQYDVIVSGGEGQPTTVEIVFKNFIQYQAKKGQEIVITYSATINENAVIGVEGNPNKVVLEYSQNPNLDAKGESENPDKPGPDDQDVIGKTPAEITKTFVTRLEVLKQNESGQALAGAEFELKGTRLNTVLITGDRYVASISGTWYKLNDGTYTEIAPNDKTNHLYDNPSQKYEKKSDTNTVITAEKVVYKGFTDADGKLVFSGLAAGEYTLTELVAPNGYNMLKEPITITITCELPGDATGDAKWTVTKNATVLEDGTIHIVVVNTTGTELPSTGGIGTTIFYVIGIGLMFAAVVLLITKKRMSAEN